MTTLQNKTIAILTVKYGCKLVGEKEVLADIGIGLVKGINSQDLPEFNKKMIETFGKEGNEGYLYFRG